MNLKNSNHLQQIVSYILRTIFILFVIIAGNLELHAQTDTRRIAVLDFKDEASLSNFELNSLTATVRAVAAKLNQYTVITRESIYTMLPPGQSLEDCVGSCEVQTGRMLGATLIVTGEVGRVEGILQLSIRLFNTEQGKLLDQQVLESDTLLGLQKHLNEGARLLFSKVSNSIVGNDETTGGLVFLRLSPDQVELELNGSPLPKSRLKPKAEGYLLKLKEGKHNLVARAQNYLDQQEEFMLIEGGVVEVNLELSPALKKDLSCNSQDRSCRGDVQVVTRPAGATLWVDGIETSYITQPSRRDPNMGLVTLSLTPGEHLIEARLPRHLSVKNRIMVARDDLNMKMREQPMLLTPNFGVLEVKSQPPNATVFLDDRMVGQTPWLGEKVDAGPHKLRIFLADYHTSNSVVVVTRNQKNLESVSLRPSFSQLKVQVSAEGLAIEGANVKLDQYSLGFTDRFGGYELGKVGAGEHQIQVSSPLYDTYLKTFDAGEGLHETIKVELKPAYAYLSLNVKEGIRAQVYLDKELIGDTPLKRVKVPSGNAQLEVRPRDESRYATVSRRLAFTQGESSELEVSCSPFSGELMILSDPTEADIFVDGESKGQSPLKLKLKAGEHRIEAHYPNYASSFKTVNIENQSASRVRLTLIPDATTAKSKDNSLVKSSPNLIEAHEPLSAAEQSKALSTLLKTPNPTYSRVKWFGGAGLLVGALAIGGWVLYHGKIEDRDAAFDRLDPVAWSLDDEASTLNLTSIGLSIASGALLSWSLFEMTSGSSSVKHGQITQTKVNPQGFRVKF